MIISFIGNDGSGKTTIAKQLKKILEHAGMDVIYEHEYDYAILNFFLKFMNKEKLERSKIELSKEKKKKLLYYIWPVLVWADRLIHFIYLRLCKRNSIIILDRYIFDHYMSFRYSGHMTRISKKIYLDFPKPDVIFNLWVEPKIAFERKKDTHTFPIEFYESQTQEYKKLSNSLKIPLVYTNRPIEETMKEILSGIIAKSYKLNNELPSKIILEKIASKHIKKISVIITTYNRNTKLKRLLNSLLIEIKNCTNNVEILLVDDSKDKKAKEIESMYKQTFEELSVKLQYMNTGGDKYPSYSRNLGAKRAEGELLFFVDDDNVLSGEVLDRVWEFAENHYFAGIIGITNYSEDGRLWAIGGRVIQHQFGILPGCIKEETQEKIKIVDFIPNLFIIRKNLFNEVNGFDDKNFPMGFEEYDLSLRIWNKGFTTCVIVDKKINTIHLVDDNQNVPMRPGRYYIRAKSRMLFYAKHRKDLLFWRGIPDIIGRMAFTMRYKIPLKMRIKLISAYIKGTKDALEIIKKR